jgi:hypothetical protein
MSGVKTLVPKRLNRNEIFGEELRATPVQQPFCLCEGFKDGQEFVVESSRMPQDKRARSFTSMTNLPVHCSSVVDSNATSALFQ